MPVIPEEPSESSVKPVLAELLARPACLICGKTVADYVPEYCCSGQDCCCGGQEIEPCVCSSACWEALMIGIGKPYDERRRDAGIPLYAIKEPSSH